MEPEELRALVKRIVIIALFFAVALMFYLFGRAGNPVWRKVLVAYAIVLGVLMVLAILLQSGRGGGLASLGGLGGDALLGTRSATPIAKATYVMGALFLFILMLVARLGTEMAGRAVDVIGVPEKPPIELPIPQGGGAPPDTGADKKGADLPTGDATGEQP